MIRFCIPIIENNCEEINKKKENIISTVNEDDLTASPKSIGTQTEISYSIPNLQNQLTNGNYLNKKIYKNKPTGRKKKNDNNTLSKHNKYSHDNCIHKIKTRVLNFIYEILNQLLLLQKSEKFFKRIEGKILKNGAKHYNLNLFNSKISTILSSSLSKKYSKRNEKINQELIEKYSNVPLINEILNLTLIDMIETLYMLSIDEFKKKYSFESKYLFNNYFNCDEREKSIMKNIINSGLMHYFERLREKKVTNKNKLFKNK